VVDISDYQYLIVIAEVIRGIATKIANKLLFFRVITLKTFLGLLKTH